jgi:hypothetical protein
MHILSSRERPRVCTVESKFWLENVQKTSSRRTQCTVKFHVKHKSRLQKYKERNKSWPYFSPVRGFWWYPVQNFLWQYLSSSCHHNIRAKLSAFHVETSNSLTMSIYHWFEMFDEALQALGRHTLCQNISDCLCFITLIVTSTRAH